jgi:hypothetical protein
MLFRYSDVSSQKIVRSLLSDEKDDEPPEHCKYVNLILELSNGLILFHYSDVSRRNQKKHKKPVGDIYISDDDDEKDDEIPWHCKYINLAYVNYQID